MSTRRDAGPDLALELQLSSGGFAAIAGVDEAGRGAWAGPLFAAAVVLPVTRADLACTLSSVRDSKQMRPAERLVWAERIHAVALGTGIGEASVEEVDAIGPLRATRLAMQRAIQELPLTPEFLLIDFLRLPEIGLPQTGLPQGDARVLSIASASVLAKVARDRRMCALDEDYPGYGFARHKGYGTPRHRDALDRLGPCPLHRRSYAPVAARLHLIAAAA